MTIEEMRERVNAECRKYPFCTNCPLKGTSLDCVRIDDPDCTEKEARDIFYMMFDSVDSVDSVDTFESTESNVSTDNPVTHPSHYTQGNIQCIDAMESAFGKKAVATWCKLNAFKYIWREQHKNGLQDINKAIWYLNKYKELKASGE